MAKLGAGSLAVRAELHPDLQRLIDEVVRRLPKPYDLKLICGWRSDAEQAAEYRTGKSQKKPGESKHNGPMPVRAVDMALYPIEWADNVAFGWLAGFVACVAADMSIGIRWGGDFNQNGSTMDDGFHDYDHWELL